MTQRVFEKLEKNENRRDREKIQVQISKVI